MDRNCADKIQFHADVVTIIEEEYTPDFIVHGFHLGESEPEQGGQHWNFTRCLEDDDGVCIKREIQQVVVYGGFVTCTLSRRHFICEFDEETSKQTMTRKLHITFEIDDESWDGLQKQASLVFKGESYFSLIV
ncbi:MAG TPA: hypothetical protein VEF04_07020 [Blastocatellia bacterium]|nr:hypothetical protein [Blastocatellia bacterium]